MDYIILSAWSVLLCTLYIIECGKSNKLGREVSTLYSSLLDSRLRLREGDIPKAINNLRMLNKKLRDDNARLGTDIAHLKCTINRLREIKQWII